ncbi:MAG: S9 family peptidase [Piscinibacter sp.]|nr:S9 family peptidase [Piscinibacter sp.]
MSPSGRYIAALVKAGPEGRIQLGVMDPRDPSKARVVAGYTNADIEWVGWVNDERLVFTVTDNQLPYAEQVGEGLFAIDREGKQPIRTLIRRKEAPRADTASRIQERGQGLSPFHVPHSLLRDGSADMLVERLTFGSHWELIHRELFRLDTANGQVRSIDGGKLERVRRWAVDSQGVARVAESRRDGKDRVHWRAGADADWQLLQESEVHTLEGREMVPLAVGSGSTLYATMALASRPDFGTLVRQDMAQPEGAPQPLLALDGYDFSGTLVFGAGGELLGVHYLADARSTQWFDERLKKIQADVDRQLPGTANRLDCGLCGPGALVLVTAWSDRQPQVYLAYDPSTGKLTGLSNSRPAVKPQQMAQRDMVRIRARDGLSLPLHVTRPAGGGGPAPAVVLVHGGPYVRGGEWKWDATSQFLASRGYAVIEPEFRGSTGFGRAHFRAGWKQWGLAMQDDIADATRWAIEQKIADPQRICIAGGSYGGYAALMGLVRDPALFRCAVDWAGVTDIDLMYTINWSDLSPTWRRYGMPALVGDRDKDKDQFAATSALRQAARITQPVLLAYGGEDRRVPIDHGQKLRDALKPHNADVEWIEYPDEGHGWMKEANQVDFWTRVEAFLERHLKNAR